MPEAKVPGLYSMLKVLGRKLGKDPDSWVKTVRKNVKLILEALSEEDVVEIWRKTR